MHFNQSLFFNMKYQGLGTHNAFSLVTMVYLKYVNSSTTIQSKFGIDRETVNGRTELQPEALTPERGQDCYYIKTKY